MPIEPAGIDPALAHQNLAEYQERAVQWMPEGVAAHEAGALLVDADLPFPAFRSLLRTDATCDPAAAFDAARTRFAGRGQGFNVMARAPFDDDLAAVAVAAGAFDYGTGAPEMVCDHRLEDVAPPAGADIWRVDDAAGVRTYATIAGESFATLGWPGDQITASFAHPEALLRDDVFMFVGSLDGAPVAAAMSVLMPCGGAYISWVAALERARGRGLGEGVTRAATNAGFDAGARFASLEASHMGEPIYARMGYDTLYRYRFVITLAA